MRNKDHNPRVMVENMVLSRTQLCGRCCDLFIIPANLQHCSACAYQAKRLVIIEKFGIILAGESFRSAKDTNSFLNRELWYCSCYTPLHRKIF